MSGYTSTIFNIERLYIFADLDIETKVAQNFFLRWNRKIGIKIMILSDFTDFTWFHLFSIFSNNSARKACFDS
jgi:hypothetical protein